MPKAQTSRKNQAKKEDEVDIIDIENDQEQISAPTHKKSVKASKKPLEPEPVQVKKSELVVDWDAMEDDISVEELEQDEISEKDDILQQPKNTFKASLINNKTQNQNQGSKSTRFTNSVTNFSYQNYEDVKTSVNDSSIEDLVKTIIVRTHSKNQHDFCRTMKTVLRAMNLECPMPGTRPINDLQSQQYDQQPRSHQRLPSRNMQSGVKSYQSQTPSMFGQYGHSRKSGGRQHDLNDPHDF